MNINHFSDYTSKRVKERCVSDAIRRVEDWRNVFENGLVDSDGNLLRLSLNEAAEFVGTPKKTLEDYIQIFHKVKLITDIHDFSDKKMGFLRHYIRKNKAKVRRAMVQERQKQLERKSQKKEKKQISEPEQCSTDYTDYSRMQDYFKDFQENNYDQELFDYQESYILFPLTKL